MAILESPSNSDLSKDDILDLLKDESTDDNKDDKGDKDLDRKDDDKEDDKELEADEDEDKNDDENEDDAEGEEEEDDKKLKFEEDDIKLDFPKKKEILKEFPGLFKKFPSIEAAIYRDRQFTEVCATPEDARDAVAKAEQLDEFSQDLFSGSTEKLLQTVKENDEAAFYRIADNYLDAIAKVDQKAYHHILGNVVKFTIMAMAEEAKANKDEELMEHAAALNRFVFRSDKFTPPKKIMAVEDTDDKKQIDNERAALARDRFESARDGLQKRVDNTLQATILSNIDPKDEMSSFVKKHAVTEAISKLESLLANDRSLGATLNRLWRAANEEKYSSSSLDKIKSAYLSKAKSHLRDVIRSARIEALKGSSKRASSDGKDRRGHLPVGRSAGLTPGKKKGEIPTGMTNKDFIMSD